MGRTWVELMVVVAVVAWIYNGCNSNTKRVKVTKLVSIYKPSNLGEGFECGPLWNRLQTAGIEMDDYSENWNEIIVEAAYSLIEKGCVETRYNQE